MIAAAWALAAVAVLVVPIPQRRASLAAEGAAAHAAAAAGPAESVKPTAAIGTDGAARAAVVTLGLACVLGFGVPAGIVVAAVVCPAVAQGLRMLRRRPVPLRIDRSTALALDLTAAALRIGRPLADALTAAAPAAEVGVRQVLVGVAGLLRLGADPEQAWAGARDGPLRPVAVAAIRSASSGIRLATTFERLAAEIRAEAAATALARAHRAGVVAIAPLGACFLPSFVCLGIIPVVVGVAGSVSGVLP